MTPRRMRQAPWQVRLWWFAHQVVNRLAWRFASQPTIDHTRWLWRLNDWCADGWTDWWLCDRPANPVEREPTRLQRAPSQVGCSQRS